MDVRRPRIKPTVNLQPKRKVDSTKNTSLSSTVSSSVNSLQQNPTKKQKFDDKPESSSSIENSTSNSIELGDSTRSTENPSNVPPSPKVDKNVTALNEQNESPFKKPPDVRNPVLLSENSERTTAQIEIQQNRTDISSSLPSQSQSSQQLTKPRQRIRPTPCFGMSRRSSIQGNSISDTEEEHQQQQHYRRQRHLSEQGGQQLIGIIDKIQSDKGKGEEISIKTEKSSDSGNQTNRNQNPRYRKVSSSDDITQKSSSTVTRRLQIKFSKSTNKFEKSTMKMHDFIYYNPSTNPMNSTENNEKMMTENESETITTMTTTTTPINDKENSVEQQQEKQNNASAIPVPQLKLGPNGEVILDEKSLVIETTAEKEGRKNLLKSEILYHDDNTGYNGFYRRQKRTKDWSYEETIKFYRCLHTVGTDFSLMLTLFPNRTRRELKLKFKKEEKVNLVLINKALLYPKTFNIDELKQELEKDEKEKPKEKKTVKVAKKLSTIRKKPINISRAARTLVEGDEAYQNESSIPDSKKTKKYLRKKIINDNGSSTDASNNDTKQSTNNRIGEMQDNFFNEQEMFDSLLNDDETDGQLLDELTKQHEMEMIENLESSNCVFSATNNLQEDIDSILSELINGSLVLVSSEDPNNPGKVINEIFIMNKKTNKLSDTALDLPEDVINYIISEAFE